MCVSVCMCMSVFEDQRAGGFYIKACISVFGPSPWGRLPSGFLPGAAPGPIRMSQPPSFLSSPAAVSSHPWPKLGSCRAFPSLI